MVQLFIDVYVKLGLTVFDVTKVLPQRFVTPKAV